MKQLLNKPQRAEKAADRAPEGHAQQHEYAQNVPRRAVVGRGQRVLQRAQRTRADRAGAGIAVEAGHADVLDRPGIDVALYEALYVGVVEQRGVNLNQPPFGGLMRAPPCAYLLSQGQYTPYKY